MKNLMKDTAERAIKTFFQSLLALLTVASSLGDVNWAEAFSTAGLASLISICMSIVSSDFGDPNTASLVPPTVPEDEDEDEEEDLSEQGV